MKKLACMAVLGALVLAGSASAARADDAETVTINAPQHKIEIPDTYSHMWAGDYREYEGGYALSNGKTLAIFARGTRMYAQIDDQDRHELVATAANTFVTKDKKLEMTINLHENAEPTGVMYMMVPATTPTVVAALSKPVPALALASASGKHKIGKSAKTRLVKSTAPAKAPKPLGGEQMIMVAMR